MGLSLSGFIFRDILRYILPTTVGLLLFVPLFVPDGTEFQLPEILVLSVVLGYIIHAPISKISELYIFNFVNEIKKLSIKEDEEKKTWWGKNWDYELMWSEISKDDREYFYLTMSYIEFYRIASLYFFVYSWLIFVRLLKEIWRILSSNSVNYLSELLEQIWGIDTSIVWRWELPIIVVLPIAILIWWFLCKNSAQEYKILFTDFYPNFARKLQTGKGGIAKSIWGNIRDGENNPVADIKVKIQVKDTEDHDETTSTDDGTYQFDNKFSEYVNKECIISIEDEKWEAESQNITICPDTIPGYDISIEKIN